MNKGACLCGAVAWQTTAPVSMAVNCHCSMCRKSHGSAYVTFAVAEASRFEWLAGQDGVSSYSFSGEGGRSFCLKCGSIVPMIVGKMAFVPVGSLEEDIERPLDSHIFVASKAPWYDITDDVACFDEYPPGYESPPKDIGERAPQTDGAVGGSCLCGEVRFEFDGPADRMLNCHCSRCRRSRSALHSTQVFVAADRFRWLGGADRIRRFKPPDAKRFSPAFCENCGSKVPSVIADSNVAIMPAGSLDGDPGIRPTAHIFTGSRSASYRFSDELPRFEEYPPS